MLTETLGRPLYPSQVSATFTRLAKAAGLPVIRFHDLRHSYARAALRSGLQPKLVSERLGHSSITITLDVYSHVFDDLDLDVAVTLAGIIDDAPVTRELPTDEP